MFRREFLGLSVGNKTVTFWCPECDMSVEAEVPNKRVFGKLKCTECNRELLQ